MKLRNKRTGEIATLTLSSNGEELLLMKNNEMVTRNVKLSDLEEWEDAPEEPKKYWFIDAFGNIVQNEITKHRGDTYTDMSSDYETQKQIGNYFETKEEAEKAVRKLKAWRRLKDKGFRFIPEASHIEEVEAIGGNVMFIACTMNDYRAFVFGDNADIKLLFGGEE